MSEELNPNVSMEDTENNNVDENSNDHQYNQYANYHNQYNNHPFQRQMLGNDLNSIQATTEPRVEMSVRPRPLVRPIACPIDRVDDEIDPSTIPRLSTLHRRTSSEDLHYSTSHLPPLPRNHTAYDNRNRLLNRGSSRANSQWYNRFNSPRRNTPSQEEILSQGEELLYNFATEQFQEENINPRDYFPFQSSVFSNPTLKQTGRDLRLLADEFARSQERREVKYKAQQVNMSSLSCENFFQLCKELFCKDNKGITQERIVVLFTFICDVAIQQVRQKAERFLSQLMEWSLQFIFTYVCQWVQEAGGWGVVLSRGANAAYEISKFALVLLGVVALGVFIKKNWNQL